MRRLLALVVAELALCTMLLIGSGCGGPQAPSAKHLKSLAYL
jgi:hypothetical protein